MTAQKNYSFEFNSLDSIQIELHDLKLDTISKTDSLGVFQKLNILLNQLRSESFLACSVDKVEFSDSTAQVLFYLGEKYHWANISVDSNYLNLVRELNIPFSIHSDQNISPVELSLHFEKIVNQLENNVYPFAMVSIKEPIISLDSIKGKLNLQRNQLILFDTLHLMNGNLVSRKYLHRYLDLKKKSPYSKEKILELKSSLRKLSFLRLQSDPSLRFIDDKAVINLDLIKKNASRFDFLFGILPSNNNGETSLTIAVDFTADLINKFGNGERFYARFQRLKEEAQDLELAFNYPFILDTPFGVDTRFELYRNANQHIDIESDLGVRYLFGGNNYLKIFWNVHSSRLLDIDTLAIINSKKLPQQLDVRYTAGGLELAWQNVNYPFNPIKGFDTYLRGSAGFKKIIKNNEILGLKNEILDFSTAYESLNLKAFQFKFESDVAYYIPFGNRSTLKSFFNGGWIIAEDVTYNNELFRIGGNKLLRGFDEESILADFYSVFGLEFRLLLAENSYLSLPFFDLGFIQNKNNIQGEWDTVMGMGGGIHFETKAGIFSFSVAVGKQKGNSFDFGSTKAHFGYVSLF